MNIENWLLMIKCNKILLHNLVRTELCLEFLELNVVESVGSGWKWLETSWLKVVENSKVVELVGRLKIPKWLRWLEVVENSKVVELVESG